MSDVHGSGLELDDDDHEDTEEELQERARASGWRPLEEFNGNPNDWRDYREFLEVGEREGPVMRRQNKILQRRVGAQGRELEQLRLTTQQQADAIAELTRVARRADQRGYDRAKAELEQRREEAVEAGDTTAFRQIDEQIKTLDTEFHAPPPPPPPPAPAGDQPRDPAYVEFESGNPWLKTDRQLARAMLSLHEVVMSKYPTWSIARQLAEARRRLVADFPEKFPEEDDEPAAPQGGEEDDDVAGRSGPRAPVQRPGSGGYRPPRTRSGFDAIEDPQERAQARNAFAQAKRADPDLTETEWIALYNDPHADVLALRRQRK